MRAVFVALLAGLTPAMLTAAETPAATRGLLLDAAVSGKAVIAVGERGTILRSGDCGESWQVIPSPTSATLTSITFAGEQRGWAAGHDGVVLHTRDGGHSWTEQHKDLDVSFLDIGAEDIRRATAVGAFGVCYTTEDGGATWTKTKVFEEELHLNRLTLAADGDALIAGESGTLLRRTGENGAEFKPVRTEYEGSFFGVLRLSDGGLLAYGLRGRVYRSDSANDVNWSPVAIDKPVLLMTAVQLRSGEIVLAGQARYFFVSRDGGRTFTRWTTSLTTSVAQLIEAPDGTLLAFGEAGAARLRPPE